MELTPEVREVISKYVDSRNDYQLKVMVMIFGAMILQAIGEEISYKLRRKKEGW